MRNSSIRKHEGAVLEVPCFCNKQYGDMRSLSVLNEVLNNACFPPMMVRL